jgi:serine/threonine protein kinase
MYSFHHRLADGGFGIVYSASRHSDGRIVAIKRSHGWPKNEGVDPASLREVQILKKVSKVSGVVHLMDVFYYKEDLCLVFPMAHRSLHTALKLQEIKPWNWTRDLLSGLHALHEAGVVHRDIKPGNLLLFDNVLKIADFGMAIDKRMINDDFDGDYLCTPEFRSPEVICQGTYSSTMDVWSAGCVIWQMFAMTHKSLFTAPRWTSKDLKKPKSDRVREHLQHVQNIVNLTNFNCNYQEILKEVIKIPSTSQKLKIMTGNVKLLLSMCLIPDPSKRPDCRVILNSLSTFL